MEIRNYQIGDEDRIVELFEKAFGKTMSKEYWVWRFLDNPFTQNVKIHLMWDEDVLAGHYAVSPVQFCIEDKQKMTALSMTTMTHPDYGGQGIFSKLAKSLYQNLKEDNYSFVWGFPNNNSHYGFIKNLDWKDLAVVPMLSLNIEKFNKHISSVNYRVEPEFTNAISNKLNSANTIVRLNKTKEYLNWRYIQNPSADYRIISIGSQEAFIIYKKIQSFQDKDKYEIDVLEIAFKEDILLLKDLINALLVQEENIDKINIWTSIFDKEYLCLEKIGFTMGLPLTYLGYCNFDESLQSISNYSHWNISMGYSDVF